ncbi:helix-turn-helix domain-containing protein [Paenibacillus radicis (ex Xue et al. 2023)]|uniref:AraC family transcriptional regulator n=1 Tax=Paenibacillus radicis (ex Xue et al. 2023) TaxID=2972489 RepID=A0ABT1YP09_9BACL|nr:AraC family transcriptional regulator [Paenibacillus radicis (ex Xue et al. 2023)]MCR8634913.1 AraC family transcriptional regulator [Paenibacillus radicis (ex Xue et al. 2023)]
MISQILTCGYSYHSQKFHNSHSDGVPCYLFRLQTEGCSYALVGGSMTLIETGDLLLFKPGDKYDLRVEEHTNSMQQTLVSSGDYYILCKGEWIDEWWSSSRKPQKVRIAVNEPLLTLWRQIILEKRRFEDENKQLSEYLLRALCLHIERAVADHISFRGSSFLATRMKSFIEEHAVLPFKVEDVAQHVGISVSRAVHLFKECFGKTIIQYAQEIRLSSSIERMVYTTMTLEQIAETTGFGSYSYFHRVFRDKYGLSPKAYRVKFAEGGIDEHKLI